jgi:hypothetical protein
MHVLYLYLIIFCSINFRTMKGLRRNCRCHKKTAARTIKIHPQISRFTANFYLFISLEKFSLLRTTLKRFYMFLGVRGIKVRKPGLLINISFIEFPSQLTLILNDTLMPVRKRYQINHFVF